MKRLTLPIVGIDCYDGHFSRLRKEQPNNHFVCLDLDAEREQLPAARVGIIRDVLQHWPSALVTDWLAWAKSSKKWDWLIVSNDYENAQDGADCTLGSYRPLDADKLPLKAVEGLRLVLRHHHKAVYLLDCRCN